MPNAMCTDGSVALTVRDLGCADYDEVWQLQHQLFDAKVERKKQKEPSGDDWLLLVEHDPVITLGRHAETANLLISEDSLRERGVKLRRIERGGDVTFHGPGQLVAYPIIDLEHYRLGVKDYVNLLEESVIHTIAHFGVKGERVEGASGVWIGKGTPQERKICALGVKCSRFCTMHGLALNVNTDLSGFNLINPCGFVDKGVTSLQRETGRDMDMDEVKRVFVAEFRALLRGSAKES